MTTVAPLDPLDLLSLARQLISRPDSASIRTGCDRAYYAAFLYARNEMEAKGYFNPFADARDHRYVPENLKRQPGGLGAGNELNRLRRYRNHYTYFTGGLQISFQAGGAPAPSWMLSTAQRVIQFVQSLP